MSPCHSRLGFRIILPRLVAIIISLYAATTGCAQQTPVGGAVAAVKADDETKADAPEQQVAEGEAAETEESAIEYVRIRRNDRKLAAALETSVVQMGKSDKYPGATVDLIGAIHLGEPEYYKQLNKLFEKYDVLLFEAVMPEEAVRQGFRPGGHKGAGSRRALSDEQEWTDAKIGLSAISILQLGMKEALGMEFQLIAIDYSADNFVHADMTAEEFESSMSRRGETFSEMFLREMGKSVMSQQNQNPLAQNLDLMMSLMSDDRAFRVRRIAAVQLAKAGTGDAFAGSDGTSTIITERNIKALDVLRRELKEGRRKVGIFYGAGHLNDMEKRVIEDFGFSRTGEEWLTAWHLRAEEKAAVAPSTTNDVPTK